LKYLKMGILRIMGRICIFVLVKRCFLILLAAFLGLSCSRTPELKEAEKLLESAPDSALVVLDRVSVESLSARERAEYDYLSAAAFYRSYYFLDDAHSVALSSAYRYKEAQRSKMANLALLAAAILATLVLYFWARKAQTEKLLVLEREENDRLLSAAEELRSRLGAAQKVEKKSGSADSLATLDRLCEQYYIYEGTDKLQPRILGEVRSIVEGLRSDSSVQKTLERSLDKEHDGVVSRLRSCFPKLKEEDVLLFCFAASGFSATTISTLTEKDKPYVYNRIYRLKEKLKTAPEADRDLFLSLL